MEFEGKNYTAPEDLAKAMVNSKGVDMELNLEILLNAPYANQLKQNDFEKAKEKLILANQYLPRASQMLASMIDAVGDHQKIFIQSLGFVDAALNLPDEAVIQKLGFEEPNSFRVAVLHYGLNSARNFYKETGENQDGKKTASSFMVYFAALQTLYLGMHTSSSLLVLGDQDGYINLPAEKAIGIAVLMDPREGHDKTRTRILFEGRPVLGEKNVPGGPGYIITTAGTTDDNLPSRL